MYLLFIIIFLKFHFDYLQSIIMIHLLILLINFIIIIIIAKLFHFPLNFLNYRPYHLHY